MYLIEKQERELQEAWEGLSLGNSIQPHLLKLKIILKLISCKMHFFKQKEPNNWTSRGETEVLWYSYWNQQKCNNWYSHWNLKANNLNLTKQKLKIPQKWWKKNIKSLDLNKIQVNNQWRLANKKKKEKKEKRIRDRLTSVIVDWG